MRVNGFFRTSGLILLSRVMGFCRDVAAARLFGASASYDALLFAVTLPNLARRLFGEGALTNALLPVYGRLNHNLRQQLLSSVTRLLLVLLAPAVSAGALLLALLPGQWTRLAALCLPYGLFVCLAALFGGVLTVHNRFLPLGFIGIAFNAAWFLGLFFAWRYGQGAWVVAAALPVGGLLSLLLALTSLRRVGITPTLKGKSPHLYAVIGGVAPALVAGVLLQISTLSDRVLGYAFAGEGAVSVLFLGERLFQLPLALIGLAGATALFAGLSRNESGVLGRAVGGVMPLSVAASGGLFILAPALVALLFGGGRFGAAAVWRTVGVVRLFAFALPAYCAVHLFARAHYAARRGWTVVFSTASALALNILVSLCLVWRFGEHGIALGTVVSSWVNTLLLFLRLSETERGEVVSGLVGGWRRFLGAAAAVVLALLCAGDGWSGLARTVAAGLAGYFALTGREILTQIKRGTAEANKKEQIESSVTL